MLEAYAKKAAAIKITQWYHNWEGVKTRGADEMYVPTRDEALEWDNRQDKCCYIMDLTGLSVRMHSPRYFDEMIDRIESVYLQLLQVNGLADDTIRVR